ncbi:hypothetical protein SNE32_16805, partial [Lysobacter sp. D1-1-M9]|uniref:hypothetical protein n=1 Tax=Novilysobacter longmucuonensis TaxID=3098603 RepID=UPI002FCA163C
PGNPIKEQDLPRARTLLLAMAENGYLPAYADLAELEMRHANPREAMKWTQVYLYFTRTVARDFAEDADDLLFQRTAYNGNLLARVHMIWSRSRQYLPRKLIREDLNDYLSTQGSALPARVREHQSGMHRRASGQDIGTVSLVGDR